MFEGLSHLVALDRPWLETVRDLIDILVVSYIIYRVLLVLRGTRAMQIGLGILAFFGLYLGAKYAELVTLMSVLSYVASSGILIIVVVFQNDIRRALIRLGSRAWLSRGHAAQERVIDAVVAAATELARHRMGALICIERDANVLEFVTNDGIDMDSKITPELLTTLFNPETQTHDGAVLIRHLRIERAGLFFPMPESTRIADPTLGSRHRAAIGITEETDAVVVVVSEERGVITLCFPNAMVQNVDGPSLRTALIQLLGGEPAEQERTLMERISAGLRRKKPTDIKKSSPLSSGERSSSRAEASIKSSRAAMRDSNIGSGRFTAQRKKADSGARLTPAKRDTAKRDTAGKSLATDDTNLDTLPESIAPPRLSLPMPSGKDRKGSSDDARKTPAPAAASVSKPMTPTEMPAQARSEDP